MDQNKTTLKAILGGIRALYVTITLVGALALLFPFLGLRDVFANSLGEQRLVELAVGWVLLGLLVEHARASVLRGRQAYLAQALMRISPDLKKREAVKILIRALESDDDKVVRTAHHELKRLTQAELSTDPAEWRRWLQETEQKPSE